MQPGEVPLGNVLTTKAYRNANFVNSREARTIRVVCEFEETRQRLKAEGVKETIMFFGSARARSSDQHAKALEMAKGKLEAATTDEERASAQSAVARLEAGKWMCEVVESTAELARRLTEWAMSYQSTSVVGGGFLATGGADSLLHEPAVGEEESEGGEESESAASDSARESRVDVLHGKSSNPWADRGTRHKQKQSLMVCTGGGPGLMEAANRGASQVPGSKNIGMGITLPFEAGLNPYVTPELAFEYHYFFTRKYWMLFPCRALIVAPGGFGTMDEMFELLTLKSTGKIKSDIPIVLLGKTYWSSVLDLQAAVDYGTITQKAFDSLFYTDSVDEAFTFVTERVLKLRDQERAEAKAAK